ncbi:MAG: carbon storage regulator [Planctomycetaceae bacterium]|nr:carbon storage regulator [Planctomycetaceae bacterium]
MLVLTRKRGERIVICENIVLTIVSIRGNRVKLGVHAPEHVKIHRDDRRGLSGVVELTKDKSTAREIRERFQPPCA